MRDLDDFQREFSAFLLRHKRCNLWLPIGSGKTITALTAVQTMLDSMVCRRFLVVSTKRIAASVWTDEVKRWPHTKHLSFQVIAGAPPKRVGQLQNWSADAHVINVELLAWLWQKIGGLKTFPYDGVIFDESALGRNHDTVTFSVLKKISKRVSCWVNMTAMPAPHDCHNLWTQTFLLDGGERLYKTLTQFRERWFIETEYDWLPRAGADEEIMSLIADITYRPRVPDELPPVPIEVVDVRLSDHEMATYRQMEKEYVLQFSAGTVMAGSAAELTGKLVQLASGRCYGKAKEVIYFHDRKIQALRELLDRTDGRFLVAFFYKHERARLLEAFPEARVFDSNPQTKADAEAGRIRLLLIHPRSAAHGVDGLQKAFKHIVWTHAAFDYDRFEQTNGRLRRRGMGDPGKVYLLVAKGTVDEQAVEVLTGRKTRHEALMALAERLHDWKREASSEGQSSLAARPSSNRRRSWPSRASS